MIALREPLLDLDPDDDRTTLLTNEVDSAAEAVELPG
jgi:hypothetical protein